MNRFIPYSILFYLSFICQILFSQNINNYLVVPKFTAVPERQSFYTKKSEFPTKLQLLCASWPPNSYISLIDPRDEFGLTRQKYALLRDGKWDLGTVSYHSVDDALQNFTSSITSETMISRSTGNSMGMQISLDNNNNNQPSYGPHKTNDVELYCLTKTNLGGLLSEPFVVAEATMGKYSNENEIQRSIQDDEFLINNVAFFDCILPAGGKPKPIVKFKKNNMDLYINPEKHLIVNSPDETKMTLLITRFDKPDEGIYECSIENPLTNEKIISPIKKKLKVNEPLTMVESKMRRPIDGNQNKKVTVEMGQNLTLFCVIEAAPVPDTSTSPIEQQDKDSRFKYYPKFGAVEITNIKESDHNRSIVCSDRKLSSVVRIQVTKKLELVKYPRDHVIRNFDEKIHLECETSDHTVSPEWYFNGVPLQTGSSGSLIISNVQRQHLGIYQCVGKKIGPNMLITEWVSKTAIVTHESERLIRTADELASLIPKNMTESTLPTPSITRSELTPKALVISDHLYAYINWTAPEDVLLSGLEKSKPNGQRTPSSTSKDNVHSRVTFHLEMITQQNSGSWPTALNGLMGSKQMLWTDPVVIQEIEIKQSSNRPHFYVYLSDKILKAGSKYRFRVKTVSKETELDILPVSDWSNILSFGHIALVDPPKIKTVKPMSDGRIFLEWTFNPIEVGIVDPSLADVYLDGNTRNSSIGSRNTASGGAIFRPDLFRILARPVMKPKPDSIFYFTSSTAKKIEYGKYRSFDILGSEVRSATINGLNQSTNYQVLIYAISGLSDTKQITRFSEAQYANLGNADLMSPNSKWDIFSDNRLMYIILASLAAFMLLVMLILVIICCCRQKNSRKHRSKDGGYPFGYKDNKSMNFSQNQSNHMDQVDARLMASSNGGGPHHHHGGTLMKMNSMDKYAQQQQAAEEYAMSIAQAQAMQQQQQHQQQQQAAMLLGSSLHLAQSPQQQMGGNNLMNSNNLPHHQSHQSLHVNSMMMMNGGGGHLNRVSTMGPNNNYHSGTLPINSMNAQNRYLMRQNSMNNNGGMIDQNQNGPPPPLPPPSQQMMYMPMGSSTLNRGNSHHPHMTSNVNLNTSHYGTTNASQMRRSNNNTSKGEYGDLNALNASQMNSSQFDGMMQTQMGLMSQQGNYYHGSQQHLTNGMATYGPGSIAMGSVLGQMNNNPHRPYMGNGNDGESIYSYFTQQQQQQLQNQQFHHMNHHENGGMGMGMGTPGSMHPHLNPLPEENNGYNENGQQSYSDNNTLNNSITGSPAQPNSSHKHHRRRKRKQQTQQQQQSQQNLLNDDNEMSMNHQGLYGQTNGQYGSGLMDNVNMNNDSMCNDQAAYQADPTAYNMMNASSRGNNASQNCQPLPPPGILMSTGNNQQQHVLPPPLQQSNMNNNNNTSCQSPLPPPNQPPPPPPAFTIQQQRNQLPNGTSQSPQNVFQNLPRIRDYSEYGIPKNILPNQ